MLGLLIAKNLVVNGRRTSMRLEPSMWESLADIGQREGLSLNETVSRIEAHVIETAGTCQNLTSSVRTFIANYYRVAATEEGHRLAGHGCGEPLKGAMLEPTAVETSDEGLLDPEVKSAGSPSVGETRTAI